jgi:hypothetical protein
VYQLLTKLYFKTLVRNPLFWLVNFLSFFHVILFFNQYILTEELYFPGDSLTASSFAIQGGITIFMFIGLYIHRQEHQLNIEELYGSMFNNKKRIISQLCLITAIVILVCIVSIFNWITMLLISDLPFSSFYISGVLYISLYWGFAFLISGFMGVLVSHIVKSKFVYMILIVLSLLIGPITSIFKYTYLNLGQFNPFEPFNALYGFPLESYHLYKNILLLLITISLLLIFVLRTKKRLYIMSFLAILAIYSLLNKTEPPPDFSVVSNSPISNEISKYQSQQISRKDKSKILLTNINAHIDFKKNNKIKIKAKMKIKNTSNVTTNNVSFKLYHGFKVIKINELDNELDFKQSKDNVKTSLNHFSPNSTRNIEIVYLGESTPLYPINQQSIYLPASFPWLPSFTHSPIFQVESGGQLHRNSLDPDNEIEYKITSNRLDLEINLTKKQPNLWSGKTKGISIISGDLFKAKVKNREIIIPNSWKNVLKYYPELEKTILDITSFVDGFSNEETKIPTKIFIVPNTFTNDYLYEENVWFFDNHLIIGIPQTLAVNSELFSHKKNYFIYSLMPALLWKKEAITFHDMDVPVLFNAAFSHWYCQQINVNDQNTFYDFLINSYTREINSNKRKIANNLKAILNSKDEALKRQFLNEWHKTLILKGKSDWNSLKILTNKYKSGVNQ